MKKFITILVLSLAAMATFTGCQRQESSTPTNPASTNSPAPTNAP